MRELVRGDLSRISELYGVHLTTLWRWWKAGRLTEARVKHWARHSLEIRESKRLAKGRGLEWRLVEIRRAKGWDWKRACTEPRRVR